VRADGLLMPRLGGPCSRLPKLISRLPNVSVFLFFVVVSSSAAAASACWCKVADASTRRHRHPAQRRRKVRRAAMHTRPTGQRSDWLAEAPPSHLCPRHLCTLAVCAACRHSLVDGFGSMAAIAAAGIGELVERSLLSDEKAEALFDDITHAEARRDDDSRNSNNGSSPPQHQHAPTHADGANNMILDSPDSFDAFGR